MNSNLNNARKRKNYRVGVTPFRLGEKEIEFPPHTTNEYFLNVDPEALKEYIEKGGPVVVLPVAKGKMNDKKKADKKANKEESLENSI